MNETSTQDPRYNELYKLKGGDQKKLQDKFKELVEQKNLNAMLDLARIYLGVSSESYGYPVDLEKGYELLQYVQSNVQRNHSFAKEHLNNFIKEVQISENSEDFLARTKMADEYFNGTGNDQEGTNLGPEKDQNKHRIVRCDVDFAKTEEINFVSRGQSSKREQLVLDTNSVKFQALYQKIKNECSGKGRDIKAILSIVIDEINRVNTEYTNNKALGNTPFDIDCKIDDKVDKFLNEKVAVNGKNPVVNMDEFINEGLLICRHKALLSAAIMGQLVKDGILPTGLARHYRSGLQDKLNEKKLSGAHSWSAFRDKKTGHLWLCDPRWGVGNVSGGLYNLSDRNDLARARNAYGDRVINLMIRRCIENDTKQGYTHENHLEFEERAKAEAEAAEIERKEKEEKERQELESIVANCKNLDDFKSALTDNIKIFDASGNFTSGIIEIIEDYQGGKIKINHYVKEIIQDIKREIKLKITYDMLQRLTNLIQDDLKEQEDKRLNVVNNQHNKNDLHLSYPFRSYKSNSKRYFEFDFSRLLINASSKHKALLAQRYNISYDILSSLEVPYYKIQSVLDHISKDFAEVSASVKKEEENAKKLTDEVSACKDLEDLRRIIIKVNHPLFSSKHQVLSKEFILKFIEKCQEDPDFSNNANKSLPTYKADYNLTRSYGIYDITQSLLSKYVESQNKVKAEELDKEIHEKIKAKDWGQVNKLMVQSKSDLFLYAKEHKAVEAIGFNQDKFKGGENHEELNNAQQIINTLVRSFSDDKVNSENANTLLSMMEYYNYFEGLATVISSVAKSDFDDDHILQKILKNKNNHIHQQLVTIHDDDVQQWLKDKEVIDAKRLDENDFNERVYKRILTELNKGINDQSWDEIKQDINDTRYNPYYKPEEKNKLICQELGRDTQGEQDVAGLILGKMIDQFEGDNITEKNAEQIFYQMLSYENYEKLADFLIKLSTADIGVQNEAFIKPVELFHYDIVDEILKINNPKVLKYLVEASPPWYLLEMVLKYVEDAPIKSDEATKIINNKNFDPFLTNRNGDLIISRLVESNDHESIKIAKLLIDKMVEQFDKDPTLEKFELIINAMNEENYRYFDKLEDMLIKVADSDDNNFKNSVLKMLNKINHNDIYNELKAIQKAKVIQFLNNEPPYWHIHHQLLEILESENPNIEKVKELVNNKNFNPFTSFDGDFVLTEIEKQGNKNEGQWIELGQKIINKMSQSLDKADEVELLHIVKKMAYFKSPNGLEDVLIKIIHINSKLDDLSNELKNIKNNRSLYDQLNNIKDEKVKNWLNENGIIGKVDLVALFPPRQRSFRASVTQNFDATKHAHAVVDAAEAAFKSMHVHDSNGTWHKNSIGQDLNSGVQFKKVYKNKKQQQQDKIINVTTDKGQTMCLSGEGHHYQKSIGKLATKMQDNQSETQKLKFTVRASDISTAKEFILGLKEGGMDLEQLNVKIDYGETPKIYTFKAFKELDTVKSDTEFTKEIDKAPIPKAPSAGARA